MYAGVFDSKITKITDTQIASRPSTNKSISDVSYESIAPAPATETLLPKRFFFDLGALAEFSIALAGYVSNALRGKLPRLVFVSSSSSSSLGSSSPGLVCHVYRALSAFRLLLPRGSRFTATSRLLP